MSFWDRAIIPRKYPGELISVKLQTAYRGKKRFRNLICLNCVCVCVRSRWYFWKWGGIRVGAWNVFVWQIGPLTCKPCTFCPFWGARKPLLYYSAKLQKVSHFHDFGPRICTVSPQYYCRWCPRLILFSGAWFCLKVPDKVFLFFSERMAESAWKCLMPRKPKNQETYICVGDFLAGALYREFREFMRILPTFLGKTHKNPS